jgi:hypothetical protein
MEISRNLLFYVILLLILLSLVFVFKDKIVSLAEEAQKQTTPKLKEKGEVLEESGRRPIGIVASDSPDIIAYKLFRNFDPSFFNTSNGNKILFNPFILDLKGVEYDYNDELINMIKEGIKNFSAFDSDYQIGRDWQQPARCDDPQENLDINYNNDCWDTSLDTTLDLMRANLNPCKILVHGNFLNKFDDKVKIRVGWYEDNFFTSATGKQIIYVLITVCDG